MTGKATVEMENSHKDEQMDLLVGYALGVLDPNELERAHQLLAEQPGLARELARLRTTADILPLALTPASPPADLRAKTLAFATGHAKQRPEPAKMPLRTRLLQLCAGLGVAFATFFGVQSAALSREVNSLQNALATVQSREETITQVVAAPLVTVQLVGAPGQATLYHGDAGTIVLAADLPQLPADKVYQLWRIEGESQPASAGIFAVDTSGHGVLTYRTEANSLGALFAITVEPAPGSPAPTTDVILSGIRNS